MPFLSEVTFCFFVSVIYVNILRKFSSLLFYLMALKKVFCLIFFYKVIILGLVSGETSGFRRALFVFLPQNGFSFLKKISNFCEISQFSFRWVLLVIVFNSKIHSDAFGRNSSRVILMCGIWRHQFSGNILIRYDLNTFILKTSDQVFDRTQLLEAT